MVKKFICSIALLAALMLLFAGLASAQEGFVYTNNDPFFSPNTISGFSVATNGTLTAVPGSPFGTGGTGGGGGFFAVNRTRAGIVGNCLFASNTVSNDVSAFTIDTTTGALTLVGSPVSVGGFPDGLGIAVAATPNGSFVMAANGGSVTVLSVAAGCALTFSSTTSTLSTSNGIKISQSGSLLAVAETFPASQVEMFSISSGGGLTSIGGFPGGGGGLGGSVTGVDINCANSLVYAAEANFGNNIVDGYSVAANGSLTALPGSPFHDTLGNNSNVVLLGAKPGTKPLARDKLAFVSNQNSNTITVYSISAKGALSPVKGAPFSISSTVFPAGMDTSSDGSLLYVSNFLSAVNVFSVSSKGVLTEVPGSPFPTGQGVFTGLLSLAAFPSRACK